jgi:hypothetical protein
LARFHKENISSLENPLLETHEVPGRRGLAKDVFVQKNIFPSG